MYTTFSVVESIPPLTSRCHRPVSFSSPQSSSFRSVRQSPSLIKFCSREAPSSRSRSRTPSPAHEKLLRSCSVHGLQRASQFTTHTTTFRPYCSTDFVQFLSQTTAEILAPPFAQQTPQESVNQFSDHQVFLQYPRLNLSITRAQMIFPDVYLAVRHIILTSCGTQDSQKHQNTGVQSGH